LQLVSNRINALVFLINLKILNNIFFFTLENNKGAVAVEGKFEFNSKFFRQTGFTKHYRAADGGQPAVFRERK
jgi:hypothetical protein